MFVKQLDDPGLEIRLKELSLINMKTHSTTISGILNRLRYYKSLKFLDISGNIISNECSESLCNLLDETKSLEFLNIS